MIRLPDVVLPDTASDRLAKFQSEVDSAGAYVERVLAAKKRFKARNTKTNATFRIVRSKLVEMCSGFGRCVYCEVSQADEVEHIRPKDLYPEAVFVWENYVYAYGSCNGPKNSRFAVLPPRSKTLQDVTRKTGDPIRPPTAGQPALIDPRREDPLQFMELDLADTFLFVPISPDSTRDFQRARYTIDLLRLNDRDVLIQARRSAFGSYRARLFEYRERKQEGANAAELDQLARGIKEMPHPTVWQEIKRQRQSYPELDDLFRDAAEALTW
jgi:uncharacterized protein (TIGR02646 family)